jgi:hypothetical protein
MTRTWSGYAVNSVFSFYLLYNIWNVLVEVLLVVAAADRVNEKECGLF